MAMTFAFFLVCYLMGYNKRKSLLIGLASFFVLIFTFSRTALLATLATTILIVLIHRTRESSIFTIKNFFTMILPMLIMATGLIFLTPIKDSFIGSNMDEMMLARMMHFYCGYEIVGEYPWLGLGLNTHLEYIRSNISFGTMFGDINKIFWRAEEFMGSNPIHNVPLILLSELGIVGTLPIVYYIIRQFVKIKSTLRGEYNESYKIISLFGIALISYILIHGMADWAPVSTLMRNVWILVFFVMAIGHYKWEENTPEEETNK
jgi:O-antigen ligase